MLPIEQINTIKDVMMRVATGVSKIQDCNDGYIELYFQLNNYFSNSGINNPNPFTDLWEFYNYWSNEENKLPSYKSRRTYIIDMYKNIATAIVIPEPLEEINTSWKLIHPIIYELAKPRFDAGHYADAVEAALKEINSIVKGVVKDKNNMEFDGADLMNKAFAPTNPIIQLDDLTTETGKNIQKGYLQIFAGAMTGIRNPKAHENVVIDETRAIHLIFLASLLMYKLEDAGVLVNAETTLVAT